MALRCLAVGCGHLHAGDPTITPSRTASWRRSAKPPQQPIPQPRRLSNPFSITSRRHNLAKAGIQNGRRRERIELASVDAYAGSYIQAVGERRDDPDHARIGIAIGPKYRAVSAGFIEEAARESIKAGDIDLLYVMAFAFDPQATGVTEDDGVTVEASDEGFANVAGQRRLGRIQVLMVRMNADLLMGEGFKKTDSANLFTVFGEPDFELRKTARRQTRRRPQGRGRVRPHDR